MSIVKYFLLKLGLEFRLKFRLWPEFCAIGSGDVSSSSSCHDICLTSKSFDLLTENGGTSILINFWNLNFFLKICLNDDLWTSTSGGIFLTDHALDSSEQTNILTIRWTISSLVLCTPPEVSLTPLFPCLFFFR